MLPYANVCYRMLTYGDEARSLLTGNLLHILHLPPRTCSSSFSHVGGVQERPLQLTSSTYMGGGGGGPGRGGGWGLAHVSFLSAPPSSSSSSFSSYATPAQREAGVLESIFAMWYADVC